MKLEPTGLIWMDGALVPWQEANVHVLTPSLHYGWGVYEGIRAYPTERGPAAFRLRDHMVRLRDSAKVYLMELGWSVDDLVDAGLELLRVNGLDRGYLRPLVYLGYGEMGIAPNVDAVRVAISVWPWGSYLGGQAEERGCRLMVSGWQRNSGHAMPPLAKSTGACVNASLAKVGALRAGYDDALLLTAGGHVAEASAANLFLVRDGALVTPPVGDDILPGITRSTVLTLARDLGLEVIERSVARAELYVADEAFLTGTALELVAVASVDDRPLASDGIGPVTAKLLTAFRDVVHGREPRYEHWLDRT